MRHALLMAGAIGIAGCAVGPDYVQPETRTPASWSEARDKRVESLAPELTNWWSVFGDATLDSLVTRAAEANLEIKSASARVREARALAGIVRADRLPEVDARGSAARTRTSENGVIQPLDPESNLYEAGFDAHWELDLFGGVSRGIEAADADIGAAIEDRRDVMVTLLAEVAATYLELRGDQRLVTVTRGNIEAARATLELTRSRERGGLATGLDVARAEALVADAEAPLPQYQAAERIAIHRLSTLLALEPDALSAELAQVRPVPAPPAHVLIGLPSDLLTRRPDIRRAERQLAAATARVGAATADRYPRFSLTGSFGLESVSSSDFADAASRAWSIGPAVRWPIFAGGRIESNIEVQDARAEQALHHYRTTWLVALEEVENALVGYLREWDHRRSLEAGALAGRRSVALADDLYRNNLTSFIDVLDAERDLYVSELQLAESETSVSLKVVSLYKALGGGWESFTSKTVDGAALSANASRASENRVKQGT